MSRAGERPNDEWGDLGYGPFRVPDPAALDGLRLHGYLGERDEGADFWAVVCDHTAGKPRVGVVPPAAIRVALEGRLDVDEGDDFSDRDAVRLLDAIARAVAEGGAYRPEPSAVFPDDFDLPDEGQWKVERDSETSGELYVPGDDEPYGPLGTRVDLEGHAADWSQSFLGGGPASDNPSYGYAVWDEDLLIVAASAPDLRAFGYLCVSLGEPALLDDVAARRRWTAALSRAVVVAGVRFDNRRQLATWFRGPSEPRLDAWI